MVIFNSYVTNDQAGYSVGCTSSSQEPSEAAEKNLEQFVSGYFAARDEGILRKGMWPYAGAIFCGSCQVGWSLISIEIHIYLPFLKYRDK